MALVAIALVSGAAIAYEVLLIRLYSIVQWQHFAFMIISIALLGYGLSGTFISLARSFLLRRFMAAWQVNAALFGVTALIGFALVQRLPFNALEFMWRPSQLLYVAVTYLILAVPFFCAANCVGLAFVRFSEGIGRIYRFDLIGAGIGAAAVIAALFVLPPTEGLRAILALGFVAAAIAGVGATGGSQRRRALALATTGVALAALAPESWIAPRLSEYKGLSVALNAPGAEVIHQSTSPLGLVSVVRSPTIPFRYVPGLSLNSTAAPPQQLAVFTDGAAMTVITRYEGERETIAFLDFTTEALPYHLIERPRVLILGVGGGAPVLLARYHDAAQIDAVDIDAEMIRLVRDRYADFAGRIYEARHVRLHVADARSFVAASPERFDLIQLPILESAGASAAGVGGLRPTYAYTVEAFDDYLSHLNPGGYLAVNLLLKVPPRDTLKLFATAVAALERSGIARPGQRLAIIRGWKTTTLLVKNGEIMASEAGVIRSFASDRAFDVAYVPAMPRAEANQYNLLDSPYFYDGATALLGPARAGFFARYKFDLRPARDDRPYFFDFFRWRSLPELLALRAQGAMPLIEWGYLILSATLVQAALLSAALILVPLGALRRRAGRRGGRARVAAYFFALGLAFLFVEIAFIQRLALFLGHPLYAVAVVLAAFLIFAGLGAGVSPRLTARLASARRLSAIDVAVAGIVIVALVYLAILPSLLQWLMPAALAVKVAASLLVIAPLAICMGMPFPLGLTRVAQRLPHLLPWAWGINGCASVISAVLATLLALHLGFTAVVALAALLYVAAAAAFKKPL